MHTIQADSVLLTRGLCAYGQGIEVNLVSSSEIAQLLKYLVPAPVAEPEEGRPTFDPIGFLASLADKVVPDLGPVEDAPVPAGSVAAAAIGGPKSSRGGQRAARPTSSGTRRNPAATDVDREAAGG